MPKITDLAMRDKTPLLHTKCVIIINFERDSRSVMKGLLVCVIKYLKIHDFCHRIKNKDGNEICNSKIVHGFLTVPSTVFRMHTHVVTKQYMSEPCDKLVGLPDAEDS